MGDDLLYSWGRWGQTLRVSAVVSGVTPQYHLCSRSLAPSVTEYAVDLWQFDMLKRVAFPDNPSGWYYWTSVYYIDRDGFFSDSSCINYVGNYDNLIQTSDVQQVGYRIHNPPGRGNVTHNVMYLVPTIGTLPPNGEPQLINVARWSLYSATDRYTYQLHRTPLGSADIDGSNLSAVGYARQEGILNNFLARNRFRNAYGELLERGHVVRRVSMWQLRHGTKRRRRNPLL